MIPELNVFHRIIAEITAGRLVPMIPDLAKSELMKYTYMDEVEITAHKVIFGVRLRARDLSTSEGVFDIDLCAGDRLHNWEKLLCWFLSEVKGNVEAGAYPLKNIPPFTKVKPYFHDEEFMAQANEYFIESNIL